MPITDAVKKQIAQKRRLYFKICLRCGSKNPISATRCRKCRSPDLRLKNRALGVKK
ncbi:MAG: 50S ribosomal protein L40e [Thaumarchaeota archaeon]|nr:50S ribosomal protein L40e [Nitrososphaerota archaeon]MCL5317879.1 50S ribosomal protein L40e [Nitrososphaerota archaeon]